MDIKIPYTPRKHQAFLHKKIDNHRWNVLVCHRRFGKTVCMINHLIRSALLSKLKNPRFAYIAPTFKQAKSIAWDYMKQFTAKIPHTKFNETELRVDLPNGSRITLLGSESPDGLRGIYLDGCVIDEYANVVKAKEVMGEKKYQQEFECDWIANIEGAVYGDVIAKLDDDKQLTRVPYDPSLPVSTAWDLGVSDHSSIIFYQQLGRSINIIDYHEEKGQGLPYYIKMINDKDYVYKDHFAPHDIEVTEFGNGKTRREVANQLGLRFKVVPKIPLEDGIHATTMTLPRCWIDTDHCKKLIDALRHYHRKYIDKNRMFRSKPVHDWSSHACDAMRYLAVGLQEINTRQSAPQSVADNSYRII
jgi:hypothetical protein